MLKIGKSELESIRRHGEETYPHECCGVLLGTAEGQTRVVRAARRCGNADAAVDWFAIDPREILRIEREGRGQGWDIIGFYHSHVDCPAQWSTSDLEEAHWLGCSYAITRVQQGKAEETNSFALVGSSEEDKRFDNEEIVIE
jgi:proteasome lid subunit RPN8/RPN11